VLRDWQVAPEGVSTRGGDRRHHRSTSEDYLRSWAPTAKSPPSWAGAAAPVDLRTGQLSLNPYIGRRAGHHPLHHLEQHQRFGLVRFEIAYRLNVHQHQGQTRVVGTTVVLATLVAEPGLLSAGRRHARGRRSCSWLWLQLKRCRCSVRLEPHCTRCKRALKAAGHRRRTPPGHQAESVTHTMVLLDGGEPLFQ
jgi:hypothetical protein